MGDDALTRQGAWRVLYALRAHARTAWLGEPPDLEPVWRALPAGADRYHRLWTDDYLAAFARTSGVGLLTLDRRMAERYPATDIVTIP